MAPSLASRRSRLAAAAASVALAAACARAAPADNTFEIVGEAGVSAQQMFLAQTGKLYVVDKTEGNGNDLNINGHPAWATEYDVDTNTYRAMDVETNSFCAGGNVLGNGTWLNVGGNQPVTWGGLNGVAGAAPYENGDGGMAIRLLDPCDDESCDWLDDPALYMTTRRWYPTLETLEDGSIMIMGGCDWGGYVNDAGQNNPTYEYFPSRGGPVGLNILVDTLPANLFPLIWLLPSGNMLIQSNWGAEIFDYKNNVEYPIDDIPYSVRTYPGSGATAMMPLTPANNWTATVLFCGGTNLQPDQWVTTWNIAAYPADNSCVKITPDVSTAWVDEDGLPEGRSMGNLIGLPDGRFVLLNGIGKGTAGYGNTSWAIGQSFGDDPIYSAHYFDPNAPEGSRWSRAVANSTIDRMYHSSATLLADGSILSSGSNPNADYVAPGTPGYTYFTEYRVERFYPDYFTSTRPEPSGLPDTLTYGGDYFDVDLPASSVSDSSVLANTKVTLVRTGFSTHAMNMGQRTLQFNMSYTANDDGSATLHVSQLPPNPAIFVPGPALMFVVVNGIPSIGKWVMVGNGQIGDQTVSLAADLPAISGVSETAWNSGSGPLTQTHSSDNASPTSAQAPQDSTGAAAPSSSRLSYALAFLGALGTATLAAAL